MSEDYEARKAMRALRGKLSKRATSSEFNEWMAREVCEYIDALRSGNEKLKVALEPFLEDCTEDVMEDWQGASDDEYVDLTVKIGAIRRAVRLVNEEPPSEATPSSPTSEIDA